MKASALRNLSNEELMNKLKKLKVELSKEYVQRAGGARPEKPKKIRNIKRDIARILTILREREVKEAE